MIEPAEFQAVVDALKQECSAHRQHPDVIEPNLDTLQIRLRQADGEYLVLNLEDGLFGRSPREIAARFYEDYRASLAARAGTPRHPD